MLEEALEKYLATREDLSDAHAPWVAVLRMAAQQLDAQAMKGRINGNLLSGFRLTFNDLDKTREAKEDQSELATFLEGLG